MRQVEDGQGRVEPPRSFRLSVLHAVLQSEDPFVVRLLFEPSGRPDSQQDYYLTAKENLCVVCGKADSYIRCSPSLCYSPCFGLFLFTLANAPFYPPPPQEKYRASRVPPTFPH